METKNKKIVITDASRLIIEAMKKAGADAFIGYPITPSNLLYAYSTQLMPIMLPAPDEITTLQWMSGLSAAGKLPITATSFPGFALMVESINMAYMMELPMVIILVQRLGPATGTATCGAQGDLALLNGLMSGGYSLLTLAPSNFEDCWILSAKSVEAAIKLRTPVILLTSKEEVMTYKTFDINKLEDIKPVEKKRYDKEQKYLTYKPEENYVPAFLPVGNNKWQVRLNASTHNQEGILQNVAPEALDNTLRLEKKIRRNLDNYLFYDYITQEQADILFVSYGISSQAALEASNIAKTKGKKIDLLILKTLLPISEKYYEIIDKYKKIIFIEENQTQILPKLFFGSKLPANVKFIGSIGKMISPEKILSEIL